MEYTPGSGSIPLFPGLHLETCEETVWNIQATVELQTGHIGKGCDRDSYSDRSVRRLCGELDGDGKLNTQALRSNTLCDLRQELSGVKSTSFLRRLLLLTGPLLCPHFPLLIPLWSSPLTGPTTLPWYRIPSSPRCQVTTSPCSCGCGGAAATSSRQPLRPEAVARRRRPSCAAPSETVCSIRKKRKKKE